MEVTRFHRKFLYPSAILGPQRIAMPTPKPLASQHGMLTNVECLSLPRIHDLKLYSLKVTCSASTIVSWFFGKDMCHVHVCTPHIHPIGRRGSILSPPLITFQTKKQKENTQ